MIDATWEEVGRMLEEITTDCVGQKLFNALENYLNGKKAIIKFDFNSPFSQFDETTTEIQLGEIDSGVLFHEMWHLYQAYQYADVISYRNNQLNNELEAYYAQYLYNEKRTDPLVKYWRVAYTLYPHYIAISRLKKVVTSKGYLDPNATNDQLNYLVNECLTKLRTVGNGNTYIHNPDKRGLANFENLKSLSKNCP